MPGLTVQSSMACPICDCLVEMPALNADCAIYCPCCGDHLSSIKAESFDHALALALAGLALLLCATWYPFLGFSASGKEANMTLLDSATSLFGYDQPILGTIVFILMFAGPLGLLLTLITLLVLLRRPVAGSASHLLPFLARAVALLQHWNMVEVFLIGAVVSIAKISSMATIQIGLAFWCFIGFTICTIVSLACVDTVQLWRLIRQRHLHSPSSS